MDEGISEQRDKLQGVEEKMTGVETLGVVPVAASSLPRIAWDLNIGSFDRKVILRLDVRV